MAEMRTFQLVDAQPRTVQPRDPSKNAFTLYELFDNQGGKWVVRQDVFNLARSYLGQMVTALCRIEQKGDFTNFFIDSVGPAGAQPAQTIAQAQYQPVAQAQAAQPYTTVQTAPQQPVIVPGLTPDGRQQSIHRQTAGKVAATISKTPGEFWENVQAIFTYFETGAVPFTGYAPQVQMQGVAPQAQRQNAAAYQPYQHQDPGPQTDQYAAQAAGDDDIPF